MPIPSDDLKSLLVETVACGDTGLQSLLQNNIDVLWNMHARRAVAIDVRYLYVQLDALTMGLDYVRMQIDTHGETSERDASSEYDAANARHAESQRTAQGSGFADSESDSSRDWESTSQRDSSAGSTSGDNSSASHVATATDASTTEDIGTTDHHSEAMFHAVFEMEGDGSSHSDRAASGESHMYHAVQGSIVSTYISVPTIDTISFKIGQVGGMGAGTPGGGGSSGSQSSSTTGAGTNTRTSDGFETSNASVENHDQSDGTTVHAVHRESHDTSARDAASSGQTHMTASSHSESHSESARTAHNERESASQSTSESVSHAESAGAGTMHGESAGTSDYFSQLFESLQQMFKDVKVQIEILEKQIVGLRYANARMTTRQMTLGRACTPNGNPLFAVGTGNVGGRQTVC